MKIIDPHLHLFDLAEGDYGWLKPDPPPAWPDKPQLRRDYLEADLKLPSPLELEGFVHIEAGFDNAAPWRELAWLERHCRRPFRSIAFADLRQADFAEVLDRLQSYPSLVGIRQILDERAAELLSLKTVADALERLGAKQLIFEAQLFATDDESVAQLCRQLAANPELRVCIGHGGFPPIDGGRWVAWQANIGRLAQFPHCAIKCSGWELVARRWRPRWAEQVLGTVIERFGIERVMLASNFPLCELATRYGELWQWYCSLPGFTETEREALCSGNARRWYGF
ncbi:amidohydrolase family protein [Marinobacterium aestuariivivens]|uniref:Amidohydrolase family protein n=1 Tax=Marinobacterium aestuariivivens TaxID=1698799 RepID=A0ABW2A8Q4_9GAMM